MALSDERLVPVMKKKRDSLDSAQTAKRLRSQYEDLAVMFFWGAGASMAVACIVRFVKIWAPCEAVAQGCNDV